MRVDVRTDAETEHARAPFAGFLHIRHDLVLVRRADRGAAIGEEDHDERAVALARPQRQRLVQRVVNRRSAHRSQVFDEIVGLATVGLGRLNQLVEQRLNLG